MLMPNIIIIIIIIIIIFLESHSAGHAGFFFDGSAELVIL